MGWGTGLAFLIAPWIADAGEAVATELATEEPAEGALSFAERRP